VPPLALIFLVLGRSSSGRDATEGGAMGAVGSLALAMLKRRLTWAADPASGRGDR